MSITSEAETQILVPWIGPPPSEAIPPFPNDLSLVATQDLGKMYGEWQAWAAFMEVQATRFKLEAEEAHHDFIVLDGRLAVGGRSRMVRVDNGPPELKEAYRKAALARSKYELFSSYLRALDRYLNAASREITRRGHELGRFKGSVIT